MKKLACLASVALLAAGVSTSANATECRESFDWAALQCFWDFHGDYDVKNFDIYYADVQGGFVYPSRGDPCLGALNDLESNQGFYLHSSTGNALKDTYVLRRCSTPR